MVRSGHRTQRKEKDMQTQNLGLGEILLCSDIDKCYQLLSIIIIYRLKYDFRPCNLGQFWFSSLQKKSLKTSLQMVFCLKMVSGPTFFMISRGFPDVPVANCATFAMWSW